MGKRRQFGTVRRLPSGRWQARYRGADGQMRAAPQTFERKGDATRWLSQVEVELLRGDWLDPDAGLVPFREFASAWIADRPELRSARWRSLTFRRQLCGGGAVNVAASAWAL